MVKYFLFSCGYLLLAIGLLFATRDNAADILSGAFSKSRGEFIALIRLLPWLAIGVAFVLAFSGISDLRKRLGPMAIAVIAALIFSAAFTLVKTSLPDILPFHADSWLASVDRFIHFGNDPWVWTHSFADRISPTLITSIYIVGWFVPAMFLPAFMAVTDANPRRVRRFLVLHVVTWIGLGNVLALAALSVGPVYYDRLLDTQHFTDLTAALAGSIPPTSAFGALQDQLWTVFSAQGQALGSGISAFPSVHVGIAMVVLLYAWERSKLLAPIVALFPAAILFLSVYVGWHYAIDGYFSIFAVVTFWLLQRRFSRDRKKIADL